MAPKRRRPWRRSTLSWEIPITRFQFSSGCCRYLLALRLLRRCCESIRSGIRSVTILVFKDWRQKRSCEFKKIPRPNLARVLSAGNFAVRVSRWRRLLIPRWTHSTCAQGRLLNVSSVRSYDSALLIVGHGSTVNPDSSAPTLAHAAEIRRREIFVDVACAFWKEEPSLRDAIFLFDPDTIKNVYVVPNFISEGYFTQTVIPRELELNGKITERANG